MEIESPRQFWIVQFNLFKRFIQYYSVQPVPGVQIVESGAKNSEWKKAGLYEF